MGGVVERKGLGVSVLTCIVVLYVVPKLTVVA
jgi:hypothetical protein